MTSFDFPKPLNTFKIVQFIHYFSECIFFLNNDDDKHSPPFVYLAHYNDLRNEQDTLFKQ